MNVPVWGRVVEEAFQKAESMGSKLKQVPVSLPLMGMLLCVSPGEFFNAKWNSLADLCVSKLKV